MENKACFIIPVYPNHYHFLDFLNTLPDTIDFDIIFILSYNEDYTILESLNYKKIYKVLILENFLSREHIDQIIAKNIIITFKKYFGLNKLKDAYRYLATVDCEIRFINVENIYDKMNHYFTNKKIYGGVADSPNFPVHIGVAHRINSISSQLFNETEQQAISKATYNFQLYFWFSDIPIYESSTLTAFLKHILFSEESTFTSKLDWHMFDYIPYIYYLYLYHNFTIVNIKEYNINRAWSLESMPITTYNKLSEILNYKPMWLIENTYNENKEVLNNDIIMIYHRNDGRYHHFDD